MYVNGKYSRQFYDKISRYQWDWWMVSHEVWFILLEAPGCTWYFVRIAMLMVPTTTLQWRWELRGFPQRQKSASLAFFRWDRILCQALDLSLKWMGYDNRRTQPLVTNTFSFSDPLWCENKALYHPSETGTLNFVSVCVFASCILTSQAYWDQQPFYLADILCEPT